MMSGSSVVFLKKVLFPHRCSFGFGKFILPVLDWYPLGEGGVHIPFCLLGSIREVKLLL